jgi:hypothetical protein
MPNHQLAETITFDRTLTKTKHLRCMRKTVRQMNTTMANRRRTAQLRASPSTRICRLSLPLRLPWLFLSSLGLPIVEPAYVGFWFTSRFPHALRRSLSCFSLKIHFNIVAV